jgi:hypothetical protein
MKACSPSGNNKELYPHTAATLTETRVWVELRAILDTLGKRLLLFPRTEPRLLNSAVHGIFSLPSGLS